MVEEKDLEEDLVENTEQIDDLRADIIKKLHILYSQLENKKQISRKIVEDPDFTLEGLTKEESMEKIKLEIKRKGKMIRDMEEDITELKQEMEEDLEDLMD